MNIEILTKTENEFNKETKEFFENMKKRYKYFNQYKFIKTAISNTKEYKEFLNQKMRIKILDTTNINNNNKQ